MGGSAKFKVATKTLKMKKAIFVANYYRGFIYAKSKE